MDHDVPISARLEAALHADVVRPPSRVEQAPHLESRRVAEAATSIDVPAERTKASGPFSRDVRQREDAREHSHEAPALQRVVDGMARRHAQEISPRGHPVAGGNELLGQHAPTLPRPAPS